MKNNVCQQLEILKVERFVGRNNAERFIRLMDEPDQIHDHKTAPGAKTLRKLPYYGCVLPRVWQDEYNKYHSAGVTI